MNPIIPSLHTKSVENTTVLKNKNNTIIKGDIPNITKIKVHFYGDENTESKWFLHDNPICNILDTEIYPQFAELLKVLNLPEPKEVYWAYDTPLIVIYEDEGYMVAPTMFNVTGEKGQTYEDLLDYKNKINFKIKRLNG